MPFHGNLRTVLYYLPLNTSLMTIPSDKKKAASKNDAA